MTSSARPRRGGARGVLLLETLLALSLTALVLAALYTTVVRADATRARASERSARDEAARAALLSMVAEIEAALPPDPARPERRFVVVPAGERGASGELRFAAVLSGGSSRRLAYHVEDTTGAATLSRREASLFAPDTTAPENIPLVAGVQQFAVRCLGTHGWQEAWTGSDLPRAVELTLVVADGANHTTELHVTAVPALAPEAGA